MANEALDRITKVATALVEIKLRKLQNEIAAYEGAFKEYIKNNSGYLMDPSQYSVKEYAPELSGVVKRLLRDTDIDHLSFKTMNDGRTVVTCPKEQADRLNEIERKALEITKAFNTDKSTLERIAVNKDDVVTTEPGSLSNDQLFYMLPELTASNAFYSLNDDGTISFLKSQQDSVKAAVAKCAAEMTSADYDKYKAEFQAASKNYERLEAIIPKLSDDEAVYIASVDRTSDKNNYLIKITNNSISTLRTFKNENGETEQRETDKTGLTPQDLSNAFYKIATVSSPVILTNEQVKGKDIEALNKSINEETEKTYRYSKPSEVDIKTTSFLRRYGKDIHLKEGNCTEQIDSYVRESDNEKMVRQWEDIKSLGDTSVRLARYQNKEDYLSKVMLSAEPEKVKEHER